MHRLLSSRSSAAKAVTMGASVVSICSTAADCSYADEIGARRARSSHYGGFDDELPTKDLTVDVQNLNLDPEQDQDRSLISILFQQKQESEEEEKGPIFNLFSLFDDKITTFNLPNSSSVMGLGHGHLILADDRCRLSLFDPATNQHLKLPKIATLDAVTPNFGFDGRIETFSISFSSLPSRMELDPGIFLPMMISRASVVPNPHPSGGFIVFLFLKLPRPGLAFATPGDKKWTKVEAAMISESLDVTCHNGSNSKISLNFLES